MYIDHHPNKATISNTYKHTQSTAHTQTTPHKDTHKQKGTNTHTITTRKHFPRIYGVKLGTYLSIMYGSKYESLSSK